MDLDKLSIDELLTLYDSLSEYLIFLNENKVNENSEVAEDEEAA